MNNPPAIAINRKIGKATRLITIRLYKISFTDSRGRIALIQATVFSSFLRG